MEPTSPRVRASLFGLATVCFFLPFVTVPCPGLEISATGFELARGMMVDQPQTFGPPRSERHSPDPAALLALLFSAVGVGGALAPNRATSRKVGMVAGIGGVLALLWLAGKMHAELSDAAMGGAFQLKLRFGYWAALLAFGGGRY